MSVVTCHPHLQVDGIDSGGCRSSSITLKMEAVCSFETVEQRAHCRVQESKMQPQFKHYSPWQHLNLQPNYICCTYVYWTVHHLDSWIKRDQLDVTSFVSLFNAQHFWMLIHPSSGACDLFDALLHELYCSGTMCVGVTLWYGWGGVVSVCRLKHSVSACIRIPHHPSHTTM